VAKLVINPRSGMNVVLEEAVWKLGLETKRHLTPYQLKWLTKGKEVRLSKYCQVPFLLELNMWIVCGVTWLTWIRVTCYWENRGKMIKLPSMMRRRICIASC
jgi:hypothetical protein